jgi:hypothetical protein
MAFAGTKEEWDAYVARFREETGKRRASDVLREWLEGLLSNGDLMNCTWIIDEARGLGPPTEAELNAPNERRQRRSR